MDLLLHWHNLSLTDCTFGIDCNESSLLEMYIVQILHSSTQHRGISHSFKHLSLDPWGEDELCVESAGIILFTAEIAQQGPWRDGPWNAKVTQWVSAFLQEQGRSVSKQQTRKEAGCCFYYFRSVWLYLLFTHPSNGMQDIPLSLFTAVLPSMLPCSVSEW